MLPLDMWPPLIQSPIHCQTVNHCGVYHRGRNWPASDAITASLFAANQTLGHPVTERRTISIPTAYIEDTRSDSIGM